MGLVVVVVGLDGQSHGNGAENVVSAKNPTLTKTGRADPKERIIYNTSFEIWVVLLAAGRRI